MSMVVNRRDLSFQLYDVLKLEEMLSAQRFAAYDRAAVEAILDTCQAVAESHFLPIAAKMDAHEPQFVDGEAIVLPELRAAIDAYTETGMFAAGFDEELGGLQMPYTVQLAANGMFATANVAAQGYAMLTAGAANMLNAFGSAEQKKTFLPPMIEGRWFGTMCLSEPQAGSSLSDIKTKAEPMEDGSYAISGSKMWISGGDQNLSENIVHMVLAKIPGGPPGVKGISLFVVPKFRVNADGSIGERNNIALAGLNHKMGYRGTTNTLLNFGEGGETLGFLVGEAHRGLAYMFHMMNEARIGVGHGACMLGLAGYLNSLDYAKNRPQGRAPLNKDPESPQVPIIEHADVRRLLLAQRAYVEGALSLLFYCGDLADQIHLATDKDEKERLNLLLDILTPVAKSWPSEFCLEANKHAIQVLGGYGYTRDYPVERFYRDNRLNPIHEGTHGIQGMDLLGRKVRMQGGAALKLLLGQMQTTIAEAKGGAFDDEAGELEAAIGTLVETTMALGAAENVNLALANATAYLDSFGHIVMAWMWLRQALAAEAGQEHLGRDFYEGKVTTLRFFFRYEVPKAITGLALVRRLDDTCLNAPPSSFTVDD